MEFLYKNYSSPTLSAPLHSINRFQDLYYSPSSSHLYESPTTTYERPYNSQSISEHSIPSDRLWFGGWGGYGTSASSGWGWSGNSAAVSALGLLSFLFFLNLIQNSLINNRWLLLNSANNNTNALAGRNFQSSSLRDLPFVGFGPIGKKGERRSPTSVKVKYETPVSIPINPIDHHYRHDPHVDFVEPLEPEHRSEFLDATKVPNIQKHGRFKRQLNRNNTRRLIPLRCLIQFYFCRFKRALQPGFKYRITNTTQVGLTRRAVQLPLRNRNGNRQYLQRLLLQNGRRNCRALFNQCRNTSILTPRRG